MKKINQACIIDDDPIFVFGLKRLLIKAELCSEFLLFENGKEAIDGISELISENSALPEIIFLDLNMPIMDGWDFLDEFVKFSPAQKITLFIVSSSVHEADIKRAEKYEAVSQYVIKPITSAELMKLIQA